MEDLTVRGLELTLVVNGEDQFDDAGLILLRLLERQVRHQTHLVAIRGYMAIVLHKGLRQRLLEDSQFVNVSFKASAAKNHASADTTKGSRRRRVYHLFIHEERDVIIHPVDGQDEVMPSAIGGFMIYGFKFLIFAIKDEVAVLESKAEAGSSGKEVAGLGVGLEPEHKRLILDRRTSEEVSCQLDRVGSRDMEGDTLLEVPRSAMQEERSAVGFVGKRLALSFVHRIVSEQLALKAGEVLKMSVRYLCWREGFCPYTCLEHAAYKSVTEVKRSRNRMLEEDRCVARRIGHLLGSRIETDESGLG